MISVNEARKILLDNTERFRSVKTNIGHALGNVVACPVISPIDVPSFDNSAMDGYAMAYNSFQDHWQLVTEIPAGSTKTVHLNKGETARIFTGSPLPSGADTIIPQELVERNDTEIYYLQSGIKKGANVRRKGAQVKAGDVVIEAGTLLTPGAIGLLASVGVSEVDIFSSPMVSVIVTGSELVEAGQPLKYGSIYNSNGPMLKASLNQLGICDIHGVQVQDDEEKLYQSIKLALEKSDVVIISGGISVGDYDFVKTILSDLGIEELFYKLKQRPGKPFYAGKVNHKWIFALPGNPASVLSCFNQFVKPTLKFGLGHENVWQPDTVLPLADSCQKKKGFTFFMKAIQDAGQVRLLSGQESFNLRAFSEANCFVELDEEDEFIEAQALVKVYRL